MSMLLARRTAVGRSRSPGARIASAAITALLLVATACVQNPPPGPAALDEAVRKGPVAADPLFWRVEPEGGATLYLLGSVHLGPTQGWRMPDVVREAFGRSAALAVEVDVMAISPTELLFAQTDHMLAPDGQTLADLVPEATMRDLESHAARTGFPLHTIMPMRPWVAAQALAQGSAEESGFTPAEAVDLIYLTRRGPREVISLETLDDQLSLFTSLPPEVEVQMLQEVLAAPEGDRAGPGLVLVIADAWRLGDEAALESIVHALLGDPTGASDADAAVDATLFDAFLARRNQKMAARLVRFARDPDRSGQSLFTVVGAAHLVGARNIRDFLTESGLRIEQLGPIRRPRTGPAPRDAFTHASEEAHVP